MKELVCHGGEATHIEEGKTPAAATVYFHSVFMPSHRDIGLRNSREGRTLCRGLDLLANREYGQLADLLAQRLKALEKSYLDGNHWSQAQWLELLPPEGATLLDRSEEYMASREEELSGRLSSSWKGKGKDQDWSSSWKGEGKYDRGVKPKGSGKDWKGGKKSGKRRGAPPLRPTAPVLPVRSVAAPWEGWSGVRGTWGIRGSSLAPLSISAQGLGSLMLRRAAR